MKEIWISTGHDNYEVSSMGRVRNLKTGRIRKPSIRNGYHVVSILKKNYAVHRLVAKAFLPNPHNKEQVNHIDGNKDNNALSNLEWMTQSENIRHGLDTGLYDKRFNRKRLTDSFITDVLKEYEPGVKGKGTKALALRYGISEGTLRARIQKRFKEMANGKPEQPTLGFSNEI